MSVNASTPHTGGPVRWAAPEPPDALSETWKKPIATVESDIYAPPIEVGGFLPAEPSVCVHALLPVVHRGLALSQQPGGGHPNRVSLKRSD